MKKYWRFQYPAHGGGAGLEALNVFGLRRRNAIPINWEDKMTIAIMGLNKTKYFCDNCGPYFTTTINEWPSIHKHNCEKCHGKDTLHFMGYLSWKWRPRLQISDKCNDGKCRTSESLKCSCSCGGQFHGDDITMSRATLK